MQNIKENLLIFKKVFEQYYFSYVSFLLLEANSRHGISLNSIT